MKRFVLAALVVGTLDIGEVMIVSWLRGGAPLKILQTIASAILGKESFQGGARTMLIGLALHFFIAAVVVAVYFLASRKLAILNRHPILTGAIYGVGVYLFMTFVVLPMVGMAPRFTMFGVVNQLFCHVVLIGIVTGLFARGQYVEANET
ncbi:MAG: hypothetical protein M3P06_04295 [Acidobacteriota bacterium]|nr:hypothetical protein [Acidobacteriota bacterium]